MADRGAQKVAPVTAPVKGSGWTIYYQPLVAWGAASHPPEGSASSTDSDPVWGQLYPFGNTSRY